MPHPAAVPVEALAGRRRGGGSLRAGGVDLPEPARPGPVRKPAPGDRHGLRLLVRPDLREPPRPRRLGQQGPRLGLAELHPGDQGAPDLRRRLAEYHPRRRHLLLRRARRCQRTEQGPGLAEGDPPALRQNHDLALRRHEVPVGPDVLAESDGLLARRARLCRRLCKDDDVHSFIREGLRRHLRQSHPTGGGVREIPPRVPPGVDVALRRRRRRCDCLRRAESHRRAPLPAAVHGADPIRQVRRGRLRALGLLAAVVVVPQGLELRPRPGALGARPPAVLGDFGRGELQLRRRGPRRPRDAPKATRVQDPPPPLRRPGTPQGHHRRPPKYHGRRPAFVDVDRLRGAPPRRQAPRRERRQGLRRRARQARQANAPQDPRQPLPERHPPERPALRGRLEDDVRRRRPPPGHGSSDDHRRRPRRLARRRRRREARPRRLLRPHLREGTGPAAADGRRPRRRPRLCEKEDDPPRRRRRSRRSLRSAALGPRHQRRKQGRRRQGRRPLHGEGRRKERPRRRQRRHATE
mmetsp:Transcript_9756/g.31775  ORF Transcript_9756/g.31775 Transcript_9756/m.31775 type:complete len:523 (-) Transcript_9756:357-1925(-)